MAPAPLILTLRAPLEAALDAGLLTPDRLATLSEREIAAAPVWVGRHQAALGDFFTVWGRPLSASGVAGFDGELSVFVDGQRYEGDPAEIVLESRMHISLQVDRPLAHAPLGGAVGATVGAPILLDAVPHDAQPAMLAARGQRVNRALE